MTDTERPAARRLGRPPESSGAQTRQRLLRVAQEHFARYGYAGATTKDIAAEAGLTSASIYHYFRSKRRLYEAAVDQTWTTIRDHFTQAAEAAGPLPDQLNAVLEAAVQLNQQFPHLALFAVNVPVEGQRAPELAPVADRYQHQVTAFFDAMAERGSRQGDLAPEVEPAAVSGLLVALVSGLARYATLTTAEGHARTVRAFEQLVRGRLFDARPAGEEPPAPD